MRGLFSSLLLLVAAVGCGSGRSAVKGKVTYEDGTPVPAGTVIAEANVDGKVVGVQGNIGPGGFFELGADSPGDGALPGQYKVLVMPVALGDAELAGGKQPAVDGKFSRFETSGISYDVKPGVNEFNIQVSKPRPRGLR